jgi:diguanylate cyclase (GGDEF)-like protein
LLEFASALEINYAKYLNPLTNLPGNAIIEKTLIDLINSEKEHCLLYFDLDNFKAYNDIYGFESGDKILKYTANLIEKSIKRYFKGNSFIGHIGGDDFLCVVEHDTYKCDELCKSIVADFDKDILNFLDKKDIENGYLKSINRRGNIETFGFTSVSIGGMYGNMSYFENIHNLSVYASLLKKEAKMIQGSSYILKAV